MARAIRASAPSYPDPPELIAEQEAICEAMREPQARAILAEDPCTCGHVFHRHEYTMGVGVGGCRDCSCQQLAFAELEI